MHEFLHGKLTGARLIPSKRQIIFRWPFYSTSFFRAALGFYHMQSAYDRDDYVTIHWENMKNGTESNFEKYTNKEVTHFNTTYDYYSVMHYEAYAFSKNKLPTIVPVVSMNAYCWMKTNEIDQLIPFEFFQGQI